MIESFFETRQSPRLLGGPARGWGIGIDDPDKVNVQQFRDSYRGHVYRFLGMRADAIADGLDRLLVQRKLGRNQFEDVEINHPWQTLLDAPSDAYNPWAIYRYISLARDAYQGAFFEIGRDRRGVPVKLFPIFPDFGEVKPVGDTDGSISHYLFRPKGNADPRRISNENMIWIRHQSPISPYEAAPIVRAADFQSDIDLFMHVYRRVSVRDGNRPDVYLKSESPLTKNQQRRYGEEFQTKYMQAKNRNEIPVFGSGLEMRRVGVPPEELEYVNGAELNIKELLDIFGIPRAMYVSESSNRSLSEGARRDFAQRTVVPEVKAIARQLTQEFRQAFRAEPILQVSVPEKDLIPLDPELERRKKNEDVTHGRMTLNEQRVADGKDPYDQEFADEPLVPANVLPLSQLRKELQSGMARGKVTPRDQNGQMRMNGRAQNVDRLARQFGDEKEIRVRQAGRAKNGLVGMGTNLMRRFFEQTEELVLERLQSRRHVRQDETEGVPIDIEEMLQIERMRERYRQVARDVLEMSFAGGADFGARQAGRSPFANVLDDPEVQDIIQRIERQSVRETPRTVLQRISREIQEGQQEGENLTQLSSRVRGEFSDMTESHSRTVARTLVTGSFEAGQIESWKRSGIWGKQWITQRDSDVRPEHERADGQIVRLDDLFDVGGEQLHYPGDPRASADNAIACRCSMLPVTEQARTDVE